MKLGIVLNTNMPETAWNALRLGGKALEAKNAVSVFLLGSGVEIENIKDKNLDVAGAPSNFLDSGGKLLACGTCLTLRHQKGSLCAVSTMSQLVDLISESDKVVALG